MQATARLYYNLTLQTMLLFSASVGSFVVGALSLQPFYTHEPEILRQIKAYPTHKSGIHMATRLVG